MGQNILIPNVAEKNILILVEEKKKIWFSFCHNVMLNFWKKNCTLCDIKINILRKRPFNLKGGYGAFLKKYSDSRCGWKKYSDFGGGKKKIIWFRVFVI
jgi:hypothetical protein